MRTILLFVGVLALAAPVGAQPYTIKQKLEVGARATVTEQRSSKLKMHWKGRGHAGGHTEISTLGQKYTEELRKPQPEIFVREYEESTRTREAPNIKPGPTATSLQGRRVLVVGLGLHPEGEQFKISKKDREALRFDRLAKALLPPREVVANRESWKIASKALTSSLFASGVPSRNQRCWAKVDLRSVKVRKGLQVATMRAKVRIRIDRTESFPEIDMTLKGEVKWAVVEGRMLEARLDGPVRYSHKSDEPGKVGSWEASGTMRWSYKAKFLPSRTPPNKMSRKQGAPPPPGTQVLICSLNPAHKVKLAHYPCCLLCGKKLDGKRKCPNDHPWVWQYCPHDGAPLEPEVKVD